MSGKLSNDMDKQQMIHRQEDRVNAIRKVLNLPENQVYNLGLRAPSMALNFKKRLAQNQWGVD